MSSRDNFKQAAKELFGLDPTKNKRGDTPASLEGFMADVEGIPAEAPVTEEIPVAESYTAPPAEPIYQEPQPIYQEAQPTYQEPPQAVYPQPPQEEAPVVYQSEPPLPTAHMESDYSLVDARRETSIIAKGTTIVGRIRTDGHIEVMGKVEGNVDAEGNVAVSGRVSGNIRGNHLELLSAQVKGNLNASAGVFVSSDTVVIGDISAESVVFDGRIKGNVVAAQSAEFNRNSYLVGDITTKTIAIEPGAVINGMIRTTGSDYDTDDTFDEFNIF